MRGGERKRRSGHGDGSDGEGGSQQQQRKRPHLDEAARVDALRHALAIGFAIGLVIGIAVGIAILICWIFFFYLYCCKPRRPTHHKVDPNSHGSQPAGRQLQSIFTVSQKNGSAPENNANAPFNSKASAMDVQLFQMGNSFSNSSTTDKEIAAAGEEEEQAQPRNDIVMYDLSCKPLS